MASNLDYYAISTPYNTIVILFSTLKFCLHSIGNIVNNLRMSIVWSGWVLKAAGGPLCKMHGFLNFLLYSIILNATCNLKIYLNKILMCKSTQCWNDWQDNQFYDTH